MNDLCDAASNEILFSRKGIYEIFFRMRWADQSPLYFVVLYVWQKIVGLDPLWYRVLNSLCIVIVTITIFSFVRIQGNSRRVALSIACLFLCSPLATWVVFYGRMYSLLLLLSVFCWYNLFVYIETRSTKSIILFTSCAILSIYCHFFGFYITALFYLGWIITDYKLQRMHHANAWQTIKKISLPIAISLCILQMFVMYQIMRLGILMHTPPLRGKEFSVSSDMKGYLYAIFSFLFFKEGVPVQFSSYAKYIVLCLAFCIGLPILNTLRNGSLYVKTFIYISLFSILVLYIPSLQLDIRDRYFIYTAPVLYIALGYGIFSFRIASLTRGESIFAHGYKVLQYAIYLLLVAFFTFQSSYIASVRYPEYSRVISMLNAMYGHPSLMNSFSVFTSRGYAAGLPVLIAEKLGSELRIENVNDSVAQFEKDLANKKNFIFFHHVSTSNTLMTDADRILQAKGYIKNTIHALGVEADVFVKKSNARFTFLPIEKQRVSPHEMTQSDFYPNVMKGIIKNSNYDMFDLHNRDDLLYTARISDEGHIEIPTYLSTQNGFYPEWNYLTHYWNKVKYTDMTLSRQKKRAIWAHPIERSNLVVTIPKKMSSDVLDIVHSVGAPVKVNNHVSFDVYVNDTFINTYTSVNDELWAREKISVEPWQNKDVLITLVIRCENQRFAHFGFILE